MPRFLDPFTRYKDAGFKAAQQHVLNMKVLIRRQQALIDFERDHGRNTAQAERLLAEMRDTHRELKAHREELRHKGASFRTRQPRQMG